MPTAVVKAVGDDVRELEMFVGVGLDSLEKFLSCCFVFGDGL